MSLGFSPGELAFQPLLYTGLDLSTTDIGGALQT
ncbi:uncharacterized protein with PIN domain [Mesorhizobium sp. USDA 4775]|jgi:hypothetical protein